jgi:hypothetical protein
MNKLTFGDCKSSIARAAGLCATDARVATYLNEATQRLMNRGKWVGTYGRFLFCLNDGCIVWPRQIETIEAFALCRTPGIVRSEWFEFQESGLGIRKGDDCSGRVLIDRGTTCVFNNITRGQTNRKIKVYADVAETGSPVIIVQGYDENGNWIQTESGGELIDGEEIAIATGGTISTKFFSSVTGVIKPVTKGFVRLYEYNTDTSSNYQSMAVYEPDETKPIYRQSLIPGLSQFGTCSDDDATTCGKTQVTVVAKLRFIAVSGTSDNEWVMLGNLPALKLAVQALVLEEKNNPELAEVYLQKSVRELERELEVYQGDGVVNTPRVAAASEWGGGEIPGFNHWW